MWTCLNDDMVKGYIRAVDVQMSEITSPCAAGYCHVSSVCRRILCYGWSAGQRPSRGTGIPEDMLCCLPCGTKPSFHDRRYSSQSKLPVCHRSFQWRRLRDGELLSYSCMVAADATLTCPTMKKRCSLLSHRLYPTSATATTGCRPKPLCIILTLSPAL